MLKKTVVGVALAAVLVLSVGGVVYAQGIDDGGSDAVLTERPAGRGGCSAGGAREMSEERIAALAEELGITVEEVEAAIEDGTLHDLLPEGAERPDKAESGERPAGGMREMSEERIAGLAEELGITVEEVQVAIEDGTLHDLLPEGMERPADGAREMSEERIASLAEELGMSVEEVQAAIEDGTLKDLLPEGVGRHARGGAGRMQDDAEE